MTCDSVSTERVPCAVWTRDYRQTGRERFAIAQVLYRVNANWILANGTLEFGTRTGRRVNTAVVVFLSQCVIDFYMLELHQCLLFVMQCIAALDID